MPDPYALPISSQSPWYIIRQSANPPGPNENANQAPNPKKNKEEYKDEFHRS